MMIRTAALAALTLALTGCPDQANLIPAPEAGDCYAADRAVAVSPVTGASAMLNGRLVKAGCVQLIQAITEAKKAGVDTDEMERLLR